MDLSTLASAGASSELCSELQQGKFEIKASKDEAVVYGSDGARVFRVTEKGVDQELLKSVFEKNASLQKWVGECRTAARKNSGNCDATKEFDAGTALLAFRGEKGKVRIKIEKRHEGVKGSYEKHAAYTPFASVNSALYRACCVAMEQLKGSPIADKEPKFVQLAPQVRFDEKAKAHMPTPVQQVEKPWSDGIVYKAAKADAVAITSDKHHKHHHKHH